MKGRDFLLERVEIVFYFKEIPDPKKVKLVVMEVQW